MNPSIITVTIDGDKFNAESTTFEIATEHDNTGMPLMGHSNVQSTSSQICMTMRTCLSLPSRSSFN